MENIYIPVNQEAKNRVEHLINKQKIFGSIDQFILLFNEGFINVKKNEIKEIANEISNSYLNVVLQRDKLYVKSAQETYIDKALLVLNSWKIISALKRIATDLANDESSEETKMIFVENQPGYVFLEDDIDEDPDTGEVKVTLVKYEAAERLTTKNEDIASNVFLQPLLHDYEDAENAGYVLAKDLIHLDDSFLSDINNIISNLN